MHKIQKSPAQAAFKLGDHLKVARLGYTHHGIYSGCQKVIARTRNGVHEYSLDEFSEGAPIEVVLHNDRVFGRFESVLRARSRLGEDDYHLLWANCEHFVLWCITGKAKSAQIRQLTFAAATVATVAGVTVHKAVKNRHVQQSLRIASKTLPGGQALNLLMQAGNIVETACTVSNILKTSAKTDSFFEKGTIAGCIALGMSENQAVLNAKKAGALKKRLVNQSKNVLKKIKKADHLTFSFGFSPKNDTAWQYAIFIFFKHLQKRLKQINIIGTKI